MNVKIRKIGNSLGIIIPKEMLDKLGLNEGDSLEMENQGSRVILSSQNSDIQVQLEAARLGMSKYRNALRELAK